MTNISQLRCANRITFSGKNVIFVCRVDDIEQINSAICFELRIASDGEIEIESVANDQSPSSLFTLVFGVENREKVELNYLVLMDCRRKQTI